MTVPGGLLRRGEEAEKHQAARCDPDPPLLNWRQDNIFISGSWTGFKMEARTRGRRLQRLRHAECQEMDKDGDNLIGPRHVAAVDKCRNADASGRECVQPAARFVFEGGQALLRYSRFTTVITLSEERPAGQKCHTVDQELFHTVTCLSAL